MSKESASQNNSTGVGAFWMLGRAVVRAPWLVIAAWAAVVAVLAVAFPPLTKAVEGQTGQPLPAKPWPRPNRWPGISANRPRTS